MHAVCHNQILCLHHDIRSCQTKNPVYLVKVSLSLSNWQSSVTCHNCLRYVVKSNHLTVTDVSGITFGYPLGNINLFRTDQQKRSGLLFVKHTFKTLNKKFDSQKLPNRY